ncbi:sulfotransferase 2B1-like [Tiliqua scincoides]|uniref:sulfotransferase 2B1-like n=1 Tax=Tiliqua scincoides TaxID=71010 RepID=UPI0034630F80
MSSGPYFTHKGIVFPGTNFYPVEHLNYVENEFQLMDDDVVSVVYPKSGTHWMGEILSLIRQDGDPTWARSVLMWKRIPWIESAATKDIVLNYAPPRYMSSHLPFQLFPKSFLHSKAKAIYTVRNLKDVLVSSFYFHKAYKRMRDPGTMQDLLDSFLNGNSIFGSWFDHVKGWLAMKDKPNVLINTYEEMQQDLRGSVERICRFLGKELTSQQIDSVVENASFETMKDNKMSNFSQASDEDMDHSKGKLMREGKSGIWKNYLTVAQNEQFDRVYQEKMKGVNVTFPWD